MITPGYKTTEFWLNAGITAGTILLTVAGMVPGKTAVVCTTTAGLLYLAARLVVKITGAKADVPGLPAVSSPVISQAERIEALAETLAPVIREQIRAALQPVPELPHAEPQRSQSKEAEKTTEVKTS